MATFYRSQIGAAGAYYGVSDTATNWPTNMGGSNGPHAFLAGFVGQFLSGASISTLPRRVVGSYSNLSSSGSQLARVTTGGRQSPARIGPQAAAIGLASPVKPY
jgi:hypothetical protein